MASIYLDYAAATPLDERVLAAMQPYFADEFYNPSAGYLAAERVHKRLDDARAEVARVLGARTSEVLFTAGGSEANNIAIHGIMRAHPEKKILVSAIEHESVLAAARVYGCIEIPVHADGSVDLGVLEKSIDDDTVLISIAYANNEVGTIQPVREIASIVANIRRKRTPNSPLLFHSDATQAANYLDLHVSRLGVDMLTLNGGKIYGPKQSGALWIRSGVELQPLIYGGGQERGLRSGTENVAGAVGFSVALTLAQATHQQEGHRLRQLQQQFIRLLSDTIPTARMNGSLKHRLPNNVHVTLPGMDNERLLMALDEAGVMAAAGSACSASNEEPSHVLKAMGLSDPEAQSSLRFTLGRGSTEADVRTVVSLLKQLVYTH